MPTKPNYCLSEEDYRELLRDQQITSEEPGTILRDIAVMLEAIGLKGVSTSSKQGNLPSGMLSDLNSRLCDPIALELKRPLLQDYPNLAGPYILLRVLGLVRFEGSRVRVDEARLARWQSLNPSEQYFVLLMMRLGLIELKVRSPQQRSRYSTSKGWIMGKARRTEWGRR